MKVICRSNKSERRHEANYRGAYRAKLWLKSLPFNVNPRGILIHRVRQALTIVDNDGPSHDVVHYWCGNQACAGGVHLVENPPADKLLCSFCELKAVEAGEPTAETLAGRHVCTGVVKAHRLCCTGEQN